jgi:hypothetical protein
MALTSPKQRIDLTGWDGLGGGGLFSSQRLPPTPRHARDGFLVYIATETPSKSDDHAVCRPVSAQVSTRGTSFD